MKPSLTRMSALFFALGPTVAFADCPLNSKEPKFSCASYELTAPLNITNLIGGPSLTIMDGNVGIGTLSPLATLDIVSDGTTATESQLILRNPNATSNSAATINTYSATEWRGSLYFIKNALGTIFGISTADSTGAPTERLRILEDGKVGIGTATPGSTLHVNGTIRAETICDQSGANCKTVSDGWGSGGGGGSGTVTSITAGTGLTGGTITTSGTIAVDVGTSANKIVQLNSSAALPAVSGANLTNVNAASLAGTSVSTSSNTTGQVLSFNGTNWTNNTLGVSDISGLSTNLGSKLDASNMPASCDADQTLTFTSPTGMWACSDIVVTPSVFGTQNAGYAMVAPENASGTPSFRRLELADLPSSITDKWNANGHLDLSNGALPDNFNLILKINDEVTGMSEYYAGFGNGIYRSNDGRSFLSLVTNDHENSLISGGVNNENYRRFRMTGGGTITFGNGLNDLDTTIGRNTNGGMSVVTTVASGTALSVTGAPSHTGDLFQVRSNGSSNGDKLSVLASGHVGIGTGTPQSLLEVAGTIRADEICDRSGSNCKTISSGWGSGGGGSGSVTSITAGTGLTGGTITTTGTIAVDVGTSANKIVQLNALGELPAVSAANLTNVNADTLNGTSVSTTSNTSGQVLSYNGTNWINKTLAVSDISGLATNLGSKLDSSNMPSSCASNQTLTFTSPTGMWACSNIAITPAVFGSQTARTFLASPASTAGAPTFRAISSADLPTNIVVSGIVHSTSGGIRFPDGTTQLSAATPSGPPIGSIETAGIQVGNLVIPTTATGIGNVAIGLAPLASMTTGYYNIAIGEAAMTMIETNANRNVAIGLNAMRNVTNASNSVAIGESALGNTATSVGAVAIGPFAGFNNTRSNNFFLGASAGYNNTTGFVVALGNSAAYSNTTGEVLALGHGAASTNTTGLRNTAVGSRAMGSGTTGNDNLAVGYDAGYNITTGSGNIAIGRNQTNLSGASSNNIVIGHSTSLASSGASNVVAIGNAIYGTDADGSSLVANAKIGIGTKTPGSLLDVAGTLRVDQICDRTGANCKTLSGGWNLPPSLNSSLADKKLINELRQQVKDQGEMLKALAAQVKVLAQKQQPQGRKVAVSR